MALIYSCNDDVAVAFITELQTDHSFYKHLVKHNGTNIDIVSCPEVHRAGKGNVGLNEPTSQAGEWRGENEATVRSSEEDSDRGQNGYKKRSQPELIKNTIEVYVDTCS